MRVLGARHLSKDRRNNYEVAAVDDEPEPDHAIGSLFINSLGSEANFKGPEGDGVMARGIDSGAARAILPDGFLKELPVMRDGETVRQYRSATGHSVADRRAIRPSCASSTMSFTP